MDPIIKEGQSAEEAAAAESAAALAAADAEVAAAAAAEKNPPANWFDDLPADFKTNPSITKFKSKDELAKGYLEIQKMVGKDKIVVPTDKSSKAEWDAFHMKAGRPADANGYETPNIEVPAELKASHEASLASFKQKAFELGVSKKAFAELVCHSIEMQQQTVNSIMEQQLSGKQTTATALRAELGASYDAKMDLAQKVVNTYFKDPEAGKIIQNHLLSNKGFAMAMMKIGEDMGEDVLQGKPTSFTLSPDAAEAEYNKIIADPRLYDEFNPERKALNARSIALLEMMEAGKK